MTYKRQNKIHMKKNILVGISFVLYSFVLTAQATLSNYAGSWKMIPVNLNHPFSKITISSSTNTLTLKFKKGTTKSSTARLNPSTNRMETFIDNKGYYLLLGAQFNTMSLFELDTNNKIGDFVK
jgi:hypothetical protein